MARQGGFAFPNLFALLLAFCLLNGSMAFEFEMQSQTKCVCMYVRACVCACLRIEH